MLWDREFWNARQVTGGQGSREQVSELERVQVPVPERQGAEPKNRQAVVEDWGTNEEGADLPGSGWRQPGSDSVTTPRMDSTGNRGDSTDVDRARGILC